jgi:hypothetical protein
MCSTTRSPRLTSLGLILLACANVIVYVLTRHSTLPEQVVDPVSGLLLGVAITVLLLGVFKQGRSQGPGDSSRRSQSC